MNAQPAAASQVLTFRVGGRRLALPTTDVAEVLRPLRVTRVPHAPAGLAGVANVRGQVVPVISLATLLDLPSGDSASGRIVLLDRSPPVGLQVDAVSTLQAAEAGAGAGGLTLLDDGAARLVDLDALLQAAFAGAARSSRRRADTHALEATAVAASNDVVVLGFMLAGQAYGLPLEQVREVIPVPADIASLPRTDEAMLGVISLRGALLPIASARVLLGLPSAALTPAERIVVAAIGDARVGLLVDQMTAILRAPDTAVGPVPRVLNRGAGEAQIDSILRRPDGGLVSIVSAERLFRDESVAQILEDGRQGAADMTTDAEDGLQEQFLVFQLGEEQYGLPIAAVAEVVSLPDALTRVPRAPAFVAGVINLRGQVVPIIEQRQRFGVGGEAPAARRRVIVTRIGELTAGFVVDSVSEILAVPRERLHPTPELTADAGRMFDRVAEVEADGRMILLVDPKELLDRAEADLLRAMSKDAAAT